jgi:hypothetical protein
VLREGKKEFVSPQPPKIPDLKKRIAEAVVTITRDMLISLWQELDYRLDVCCVTNGAHIKHLWACILKKSNPTTGVDSP